MKTPSNSLFHLHIGRAFAPETGYLVAKIRKIPYIAHVHINPEPSGRLGFLLPLYKRVILRNLLQGARKIVVPTEDYISLIAGEYLVPRNKILVISYGIHFKDYHRSKKVHSPVRILFVGRLVKQKNLLLLIESFKKIMNAVLYIVGDGDEKNNLLKLTKNLNVVLCGPKYGKELYKIYSESDIFILTSNYESFGIVMLEAMASGLPVVASDISSVRNIIKDNGLLAKTSDDFANAINELIHNEVLRNKLKKRGIRYARQFDWQRIFTKYRQLWN